MTPESAQDHARPDRRFPAFWWIAHVLVLVWAAFWMWFGAVSGAEDAPGGIWRNLPNALPGLLFLVLALMAFRWERALGWVFIFLGVGLAIFSIVEQDSLVSVMMMLLLFAGPPLAGGILMLVRSKRLTDLP